MTITIINYKCKSLNDYFGKHWTIKGAITSDEQNLAFAQAKNHIQASKELDGIKFKTVEKCKIIFTAYYKDKRRHDPDNLLCKNFIDGIVKAGIIKDDNSEVVLSLEKIIKTGQNYNGIDIEIL